MKLGELKAHIRSMDGNPKVYMNYGGPARGLVTVQKKSLLETLDVMFPTGKTTETGLMIDAGNRLILETMSEAVQPALMAEEPEDLDSLDAVGEPDDLDEPDEL
ncbi:hypothetical protein IQ03_02441 [Gemmobacter caeni]|uniref:Uncharacterized protein n=1 Tax=Gemmobacter caeni TaxID=589035 RepID=A0A2T6AZ44_9RHOB|nr:hypothetical protein [Gemmobacter caeni]PTX49084.1 hypothetical protein C8N34_108194 [Gemmobacter caeni]TWI98915.1 hypothetical protein IQ03_02441 [Gemmobacter caeni]